MNDNLKTAYALICLLTSFVMIMIVLWLFLRLLIRKRLSYFESIVLVGMTVFYAIGIIYYYASISLSEASFYLILKIFITMNVLLPSFYHWMFVS